MVPGHSFLSTFTTHLLCHSNQIVSPFYGIHNPKYPTFVDRINVELSSGSAIQIDAIPSMSSDGDWGKDFPYIAEEFEKLKQQAFSCKRPRKSKQNSLITSLSCTPSPTPHLKSQRTPRRKRRKLVASVVFRHQPLDADSSSPSGLVTQRESHFCLKTAS